MVSEKLYKHSSKYNPTNDNIYGQIIHFPFNTYNETSIRLSEYNDNIKDDSIKNFLDGDNKESIFNDLSGGIKMDVNDILSKYMEKVDRDQSDLRQDIRESEKRIYEHTKAIEERIMKTFEKIDSKIDNLENKFEDVKDKVYESNKQYKWWVIGIFVAIIGVVLASSYAVVQILTSIVTP